MRRAFLAECGCDPAYGARPLKRAIMRYVEPPCLGRGIAEQILDGSSVDVAVDGDRFTFTPTVAAEPPTDDNVDVVEDEIVDAE